MSRQRGFALLVVLWSMALLALLGAQLTGAGRTEAQIARNLRASAGVEAAADGAVQEAIFHLLASGEARWGADGVLRRWRIGEAAVEVRIFSESGKLNPNRAPIAVMAALLRRLGAEPRRAGQVAAAQEPERGLPELQTLAAAAVGQVGVLAGLAALAAPASSSLRTRLRLMQLATS